MKLAKHTPLMYTHDSLTTSTSSLHTTEFDGGTDAELPIINQNMCGSCWAIACSMALKANLQLKKLGMKSNEIPNLNYLIACSNRPHQIVNMRNSDPKWIIELSASRPIQGGCEGGITGMGLSMLQIANNVFIDDVNEYRSGTLGDMTNGPVEYDTLYNLPHLTCEEATEMGNSNKLTGLQNPLRTLDTMHLFRRDSCKRSGVYFPCTRDVREMVYKHSAVIVFIDMDQGFQKTTLYGMKGVATLQKCRWSSSDYTQSGNDDMNSLSQFQKADHAVLLIGWSCEKSAWLVQNSWGSEWGENGRLWVHDPNVCSESFVPSGHSDGAGPACMFGSTMSVFTH